MEQILIQVVQHLSGWTLDTHNAHRPRLRPEGQSEGYIVFHSKLEMRGMPPEVAAAILDLLGEIATN